MMRTWPPKKPSDEDLRNIYTTAILISSLQDRSRMAGSKVEVNGGSRDG